MSGLLNNFDQKEISFKLGGQTKLQEKVKQYFGSEIQFDCTKHENEFPEYHVEKDNIVGEQKIKCSLHPKGYDFEPLYEIDLNLAFTINPKVDSDGKSLKAEFEEVEITEISVHDKMEVNIHLYDNNTESQNMWGMPGGFMMEFDFPIIDGSEMNDEDREKLEKFKEIFQTPDLIDYPQLEMTFMPMPFLMPLPPGLKFDPNSEVKIHENGVIDVSGDIKKD